MSFWFFIDKKLRQIPIFLYPCDVGASAAQLPFSAEFILFSATGTAIKKTLRAWKPCLCSSSCGPPMCPPLFVVLLNHPWVFSSASFSIYLYLVVSILSFSVLFPLWVSEEHVPSHRWCFLALIVVPIHVIRWALSCSWVTEQNRGKTPAWHFNLTVSTSPGMSKLSNSNEVFQGRHTHPLVGWSIFNFSKPVTDIDVAQSYSN